MEISQPRGAVTRATLYANRIALYTPSRLVIGSRAGTEPTGFRCTFVLQQPLSSAPPRWFLSPPIFESRRVVLSAINSSSSRVVVQRGLMVRGSREQLSSVIRSTVIIIFIDLSRVGEISAEKGENTHGHLNFFFFFTEF